MTLSSIDTLLGTAGLIRLGAFHPGPSDGVPGFDSQRQGDATLILAGNAGPAMWRVFSKQRRQEDDPHPLDGWSHRCLTRIASELSDNLARPVQALFPFGGPPYLPFQRWAHKSGDVAPSPFGPMVHKKYGLWHAYRGALLIHTKLEFPLQPGSRPPSHCADCDDKPCMSACPVNAFGSSGYDVPACIEHLASGNGEECFRLGCLARHACPIGREYAYGEDHARFHLGKFFAAHTR